VVYSTQSFIEVIVDMKVNAKSHLYSIYKTVSSYFKRYGQNYVDSILWHVVPEWDREKYFRGTYPLLYYPIDVGNTFKLEMLSL
jgi:glutamate formiminotransferase